MYISKRIIMSPLPIPSSWEKKWAYFPQYMVADCTYQ